MIKLLYNYYKVIQGNYGYGWSDEDHHETNSQFNFKNPEARKLFKENLKAYRECGTGSHRVVNRWEAVQS